MGHTLVTAFDENGIRKIENLLDHAGVRVTNKIPFGRNTDRDIADSILPYHVTTAHWGKNEDEEYIGKLDQFRFSPCSLKADHAEIIPGAENSLVLCIRMMPERGWKKMMSSLNEAIGAAEPSFLHMTLSVSKDHSLIKKQYESLKGFEPFSLEVTGLDLYHIWNPVKFVRRFDN